MISIEKEFINLEMTLSVPTADLKNILESIYSESRIKKCEEKYNINQNKSVELFTIAEVSRKLKVNVNYVYTLIKVGHLSALKLGSLKVTSTELERFINYSVGKDFSDLNNITDLKFNE